MKRTGLMMVAILWCTMSFAQFRYNGGSSNRQKNSDDLQNRFYFSGGGGFGAGTGYNYYSFFPMVGYRITTDFSAGLGFTYQRYNYTYNSPTVSLTQYGLTPFLRYNFKPLFFQTEIDLIEAPNYYNQSPPYNDANRQLFTRWLLGIGYSLPMGRNNSLNALAAYDVLYRTPSVFQSPIVARVFFTFGM
jgi:hypothetical protein